MKKIKKVAVIGTGVIGAGWIIRCLAHNKIVHAFDKEIKLKKNLISEIKRTWPYVKKLFNKKTLNLKNFKYFTSIEEALKDADFIQECASENYALKTKLMSTIGKYAKPNAIISSSSSGLLPTRIYSKCKNPERAMIGHPFNPVYLLPAVEIVPGKKTSKNIYQQLKNFIIQFQ
ncbi:3-hydroxyacyl-CoA dehydrogenase NAD-binding domain-containing protein [Candidatus Pelagibacter sp.]|nr:3-hydroxyacyl-CoA dehydrogenase NAD-binding domain-containing protein [Candidatus Pelagibacter sp.]